MGEGWEEGKACSLFRKQKIFSKMRKIEKKILVRPASEFSLSTTILKSYMPTLLHFLSPLAFLEQGSNHLVHSLFCLSYSPGTNCLSRLVRNSPLSFETSLKSYSSSATTLTLMYLLRVSAHFCIPFMYIFYVCPRTCVYASLFMSYYSYKKESRRGGSGAIDKHSVAMDSTFECKSSGCSTQRSRAVKRTDKR